MRNIRPGEYICAVLDAWHVIQVAVIVPHPLLSTCLSLPRPCHLQIPITKRLSVHSLPFMSFMPKAKKCDLRSQTSWQLHGSLPQLQLRLKTVIFLAALNSNVRTGHYAPAAGGFPGLRATRPVGVRVDVKMAHVLPVLFPHQS